MGDTATTEKTGVETEEDVKEVKAADDTSEQQKDEDSAEAVEEEKKDEDKPDGDEKGSAAGDEAGEEDEFTPEDLEYAAACGFSEEKARACGTRENLNIVLSGLEDALAELGPDDKEPAPKAAKPKPDAEKAQEPDIDFDALMPEGEFDPATKKVLMALAKSLKADVAAARVPGDEAKAALAELTKGVSDDRRQAHVAQADAFFESVEKEHEDLFGKGPSDEMSTRSRQWRARVKLDNEVEEIAHILKTAGRSVPQYRVLAKRALTVVFGERIARKSGKKAASDVKEQLAKRAKQKTSPPAKRAGKELKGEALAIRKAEEFDRTHTTE